MKNLLMAAFAAFALLACNEQEDGNDSIKNTGADLENRIDSVSYALGIDIGNSFATAGFDSLNINAMAAAIRDVIDSNEMKITPEQADGIVQKFFADFRIARLEKNLKAGEEFLAENRKNKNVKETESGLQYTIVEEGNGPQPRQQDTVVFHYRESLPDGKEIRNSREGDRPPLRVQMGNPNLYEAWKEAFPMMKEGATWKLFAPAKLAYGEEGANEIEGNQVIVFEVEIVEVIKVN